ncbi:MAG: hypothetical protein B6U97_01140 [Candidatus Altiarchaeales archaeon ex4484_96]|nr:MAG: hypothetical protein B6U97_01140 [Candidatus Altiarchaeales archaeon ex4484_96]
MAKIMVVDDEENIRESVRDILAAEGYDVEVASNANEAWLKIEQRQVDLILLDVMMPGMTVDKFIEKILQRYGQNNKTRIIYISGVGFLNGQISKKDKIKHLTDLMTKLKGDSIKKLNVEGVVVDLLEKPFDKEGLLAKVSDVLGGLDV